MSVMKRIRSHLINRESEVCVGRGRRARRSGRTAQRSVPTIYEIASRRYTLLLTCVLISGDLAQLLGANMHSFIESVRRKALVVYVGSVKEVQLLQRTKFDIKAKAVVAIEAVMRTPGTSPRQATIEYSSFDEKT